MPKTPRNDMQVLALTILVAALSLGTATAASAQAIPVTPDTAPPPLISEQPFVVDAGSGNNFDPHVSGNLIVYTCDTAICFFRVGIDTAPQQIPMGSSLQDLLSDVSGTLTTFSRVLPDGTTAIMLFDTSQPASTTNPFEVDPATGVTRFSGALGGNTLAFTESDLATGGELVVYDIATASSVRLTNDSEIDASPNVSPDGNTIVWQHCVSSYTLCDVWKAVKTGATWTVSVVSSDPADEELPDTNGTVIVYGSDRPSDAGDIFWRDSFGTERELLLAGTQINANIAGDFVVFESRNGGPGDIDLYQISTNRLWNLTSTATLNEELDDVSVLSTGEVLVVYDSDEYGSTHRTVHALRFTVPSASGDNEPPSITIDSPVNGGFYPINTALTAQYSCTDSESGIASCQGTVANGAAISTTSVGPQSFVVNAEDLAGNTARESVDYVVGYQICLQYDSSKAKKSGSVYPIRIALCDAGGQNVSSSAVVVHAVGVTLVSANASGVLDDAGNSNPDFDFRYDAATLSYVFNLKTTGFLTGTYTLGFTAGADPIVHLVPFQIR